MQRVAAQILTCCSLHLVPLRGRCGACPVEGLCASLLRRWVKVLMMMTMLPCNAMRRAEQAAQELQKLQNGSDR